MHYFFFFFNDTATTEIYTLSLHDALPISPCPRTSPTVRGSVGRRPAAPRSDARRRTGPRQARDPGRAGRGRASQPLHELLETFRSAGRDHERVPIGAHYHHVLDRKSVV